MCYLSISLKLINKITRSCGRPRGEESRQLSENADKATIRDHLSLRANFQSCCCHLWYQSLFLSFFCRELTWKSELVEVLAEGEADLLPM